MKLRFKATENKKTHLRDRLWLKRDGQTFDIPWQNANKLIRDYPDNFEPVGLRPRWLAPKSHEPLRLSRITLITVRYWPKEVLEKNLLSNLPEEIEFIQLDNPNNERWTSMAKALNYGIRKAANDIVICAHEDVKFSRKWFDDFLRQEASLKKWGALGILGMNLQNYVWWGSDNDIPKQVPLLDECCIILNRKNGLLFDEKTFTDWHSYGLDFCLQCRQAGLGVYTLAGSAHHAMVPHTHSEAWRRRIRPSRRLLKQKWGPKLPELLEGKIPKTKGKVAFIPFRDINTASSRFRCYQNSQELKKLGWSCELGGKNAKIADFVIFQKRYSVSDLNLAKQCRGKIILDMCDPNWLVGQKSQIEAMAKIADYVTTSSTKLANWFREKTKMVKVIPDGFDFKAIPKVKKEVKPTICWIGDKTNEKYLQIFVEPLNKLREELDFTFKIIGNFSSHKLPRFNFKPQFIEWKLSTELKEIAKCHVGVAPLFTDEWCSYKGTNKPIAYMALGLPVVATKIDSYQKIIIDGKNGFLINENNPEKWYQAIKTLVADKTKRSSFIEEGRKTAQAFSIDKIAKRWNQLFMELVKL